MLMWSGFARVWEADDEGDGRGDRTTVRHGHTGASCGHVTLSWIPGDGRNGTRSWVLAIHDGGSIRRIRLSWNELGDLAAILQSIANEEKEMGDGR